MINIQLDKTFIKKTVRTSTVELQFRYNTNGDYFYFNIYGLDGNTIGLHNRVSAGYDFGGVSFESNTNSDYASITTIESFRLLADG